MDGFSSLRGILGLVNDMAAQKYELAARKLGFATNAVGFAAAVKKLGFDFTNIEDSDLMQILQFVNKLEELI